MSLTCKSPTEADKICSSIHTCSLFFIISQFYMCYFSFSDGNLSLNPSYPTSVTLLDWGGILPMPCVPLNRAVYFALTQPAWENIFPRNLQNGICVAMDGRLGPDRVNINTLGCRPLLFGLASQFWEPRVRGNLQELCGVTGKHW